MFPIIFMIGVAFSIDEMSMRFKGHHADKENYDTQRKRCWITGIQYLEERMHI